MKIEWRKELPHLAVLAALLVVAGIVWPQAPDSMPVHWNLAGDVDRYGGKFEGVLALPLLTFGLYWLLLLIPFIDPRRENYARFATPYRVMRWSLTLFMGALYGLMLAVAFGRPVDMSLSLSLLMALLFVVLGLVMDRVEPNWFVGVRTPWTLSSSLSWTRTHHAAKWVFVALGLSFVPLGLWKSPLSLGLVFVTGLGGVTWLVVFSYLVWKSDPQRLMTGGTQQPHSH
jgi:uncharacterized membrane protein